jgi:Phage integrase, N-terminal SAM-like domain
MATVALPTEHQITLASYLAAWLAHIAGRVRPKTLECYETLIRLHAEPRVGSVALESLTPLDLQGLYSQLLEEGALGSGTVLNLHLVLQEQKIELPETEVAHQLAEELQALRMRASSRGIKAESGERAGGNGSRCPVERYR